MPEVTIAILAAGEGKRMGRPKQLVQLEGETLLARSIRLAQEAGFQSIYLILGYQAQEIRRHVDREIGLTRVDNGTPSTGVGNDARLTVVENEDWREGIASSIRTAVNAVIDDQTIDAIVFTTCDQPFLTSELLMKLRLAFRRTAKPIVAAYYDEMPGIPALFGREKFQSLLQLNGDRGAKQLIANSDHHVIHAPDASYDIDTESDLIECMKVLKPDGARLVESEPEARTERIQSMTPGVPTK